VRRPQDGLTIGTEVGGRGCATGPPSFDRPGFPSLTRLVIYEKPQPTDVVLTTGPHSVGYRKQSEDCLSDGLVNRNEYSEDYLMYLAADSNVKFVKDTEIVWVGAPAYQTSANEFQLKIRGSVAHLKSRLVERKLLTPEEAATANPKLEVHVIDQRAGRLPVLPDVRWKL